MARLTTTGLTNFVAALWLMTHGALCVALDNPDAADLVSEFQARSEKYETVIYQQAQTERETVLAYRHYEQFLDQELNQAYSALMEKLKGAPKRALTVSQRHWIQYRDAEFMFIASNWTVANFGTSSALSKGAYRTTLIKDRVVGLLNYLKNY